MAGGPTRQDTHRITVSIEHPTSGQLVNYGVFDKWTGGAADSDDQRYYPGGMAPQISLGGRKMTDNVTISRLYRLERDHPVMQQLFDSRGLPSTIQRVPLDIQGQAGGKPIVYQGRLKTVTPPPLDSEQSGPALLELVFVIDGDPTV